MWSLNYWKLDLLSEWLFVDECFCSTSVLTTGQELVIAGASLAVAGIVDCITLETRQGWLRMLHCHTALYREAVFTVRVVGTVSVVATPHSIFFRVKHDSRTHFWKMYLSVSDLPKGVFGIPLSFSGDLVVWSMLSCGMSNWSHHQISMEREWNTKHAFRQVRHGRYIFQKCLWESCLTLKKMENGKIKIQDSILV